MKVLGLIGGGQLGMMITEAAKKMPDQISDVIVLDPPKFARAQKDLDAALKEFAKTIGAPAAPVVSAEAPAKKEESKKFEDILKAKKDELKGDVAAAMSFCIKNHSSEYLAYRTRVAQGEIIKL